MKSMKNLVALVLVLVSLVSFSVAFASDIEECIPCQANQLEAVNWVTPIAPNTIVTIRYADNHVIENVKIGSLWCEGQDFESFHWRRLGWHHAAVAQSYRDQETISFNTLGITLGWDGDVGVIRYADKELRTVVETRPERKDILPIYFPQDAFYAFMTEAGFQFPYDAGINYWTCPYGTTSWPKAMLWLAQNNADNTQIAELIVKYAVENNCEPILSDYFRIEYSENGTDKVLHDGTRQSYFLFRTDRVVQDVRDGMIEREFHSSTTGLDFVPQPWHQVTYVDWFQAR